MLLFPEAFKLKRDSRSRSLLEVNNGAKKKKPTKPNIDCSPVRMFQPFNHSVSSSSIILINVGSSVSHLWLLTGQKKRGEGQKRGNHRKNLFLFFDNYNQNLMCFLFFFFCNFHLCSLWFTFSWRLELFFLLLHGTDSFFFSFSVLALFFFFKYSYHSCTS